MEGTSTAPSKAQRARVIGGWVFAVTALAFAARWVAGLRPSAPAEHVTAAGAFAPSRPAEPPTPKGTTFRQPYEHAKPRADGHTRGLPFRALDTAIFEALEAGGIPDSRLDDVFPSAPYKVKFIRTAGVGIVGAIQLDSNRSGTWDEMWTLTAEDVTRTKQNPSGIGSPTVPFKLGAAGWLPY